MQCLGLAPVSQQQLEARFQANLGAITRPLGVSKIQQVGDWTSFQQDHIDHCIYLQPLRATGMQCLGLAPISQQHGTRFPANLGGQLGISKIRQVGFSRQGFGKDFYKIILILAYICNPCEQPACNALAWHPLPSCSAPVSKQTWAQLPGTLAF